MASVDAKKNTAASGDWSSLPLELLEIIGTKIKIHSDYVRFRAVCHPWRSSSPATPTHLPCQLPWVLLAPPQGGGYESSSDVSRCSFIEVASDKHRHLRLPETLHHLRLLEILHRRRCYRGSSHGWIVILENSPSVVVLNPLTGAKFNLPPLSTPDRLIYDNFIRKIILSDSPCRRPDDFTALAIFNLTGELACWKSGQDDWTLIVGVGSHIEAVYFQGLVYAMDLMGTVTICDVNCNSPNIVAKVEVEMQAGGRNYSPGGVYLVPACDDLFFVVSILLDGYDVDSETRGFQVCKLSSCGKRWERVNDLGNIALFLGSDCCSTALTASDFPACKPNSIYFTKRSDLAIFSLEDGSIQRSDCVLPDFRHSIWFTPNPF